MSLDFVNHMQLQYICFTVLLYISNKLFPNGCSEEAVKSQQTTADDRINIFGKDDQAANLCRDY